MERFDVDPAPWHVIARGTRRMVLYRDDQDFTRFLNCLLFGLKASGCELWGYALMSNHYHLVLYGTSRAVSECMYHTDKLYAHYHNDRYALQGHVFDAPYKAFRIRSPRAALWTLAYVFVNPVKPGLCGKPEDYPWSGYRSFVGMEGSPIPVRVSGLMDRIDLPLDQAWARFYDCIRVETLRAERALQAGPTMGDVHLGHFQWLLHHAKENRALLGDEDPVEVAIYWGRQCGIAPRVMAKALGMPNSNSLRLSLFRFKARMMKEPALARLAAPP